MKTTWEKRQEIRRKAMANEPVDRFDVLDLVDDTSEMVVALYGHDEETCYHCRRGWTPKHPYLKAPEAVT